MLYGKKHSYEVNLFTVFAPQRIPEGDNCILHTSITLDSHAAMNVHVCALSSMQVSIATIMYVLSSSTSRSTLPLVKHFNKA